MSVAQALADAAQKLAKTSDTPLLDAQLLMAHALGVSREALLLAEPDLVIAAGFSDLLDRRIAGEPVAYIIGVRAFWTIELAVAPGVLIPRPDSETLIEAAVTHFAGSDGPRRVLDLGTGSGALLLAALAEWPDATGVGIDRSEAALLQATANAARLGLADRATLRLGDWAEGIGERFDLVLCNPPYVARGAGLGPGVAEYEPDEALFGGGDGLDHFRRLAPDIARLIAPSGLAAIEIGFDQAIDAAQAFEAEGHSPVVARDLAGRPRVLLIRPHH